MARRHREALASACAIVPFVLLPLTSIRAVMDPLERALDAVAPPYGIALLTVATVALIGALLGVALWLKASADDG